MTDGFDPLEGLTQRQRLGLQELMAAVDQTHSWSWNMPVLIRQRCWLRLDCISLGQLNSVGSPRTLGRKPLNWCISASCAPTGCRRWRPNKPAGRNSEWTAVSRPFTATGTVAMHRRQPWTSHHFLELVTLYRRSFEVGQTRIPMLVLPRIDSVTGHQLHWLSISPPPMRHTCR